MLNSKFVHDQAAGLATRLIKHSPKLTERVKHAYRLVYSREPDESELKRTEHYLERYTALLGAEGVEATKREAVAWASLARIWLTSNEFLFVY